MSDSTKEWITRARKQSGHEITAHIAQPQRPSVEEAAAALLLSAQAEQTLIPSSPRGASLAARLASYGYSEITIEQIEQ